TTRDMYDIIASDPLDVFAKGTAAIYSKEYFEAVKRHLNPGGLFTLYVPLYESDVRTVKSELATFFEAFPHATIWANTVGGLGNQFVARRHDLPAVADVPPDAADGVHRVTGTCGCAGAGDRGDSALGLAAAASNPSRTSVLAPVAPCAVPLLR